MDFTLTPEPVYSAVESISLTGEQPVDLDFILPDYCADVEKVFKCTVCPEVYSVTTGGGQLNVEGASVVRVLYCSTDRKSLKCAEQTLPFSASFNLNLESDDYITSVKAKPEYINCKALSARRLMIHGAVTLYVKAIERKASNLYLPADDTTLQTDIRKTTVSELISMESEIFSVTESITTDAKSPVSTILRSDVRVSLTDTTALGNRLLIKGELTLCMLYISDLNPQIPEQLTYVFPFAHTMDLKGCEQSTLRETDITLMSYDIKLKSDIAAENPVVILECRLCASVACRKETEVSYICDAYSTTHDTEQQFTPLTLDSLVLPKVTGIMSKSTLEMGETQVARIIDIFCDNISVTPNVSDILKLTGKANFCILAQDADSNLIYIERSTDIDSTEPLSDTFSKCADISAVIKSVSYRLSDNNSLELRAEISVLTKLIKNESIRMVSGVENLGEFDGDDGCALTLYFADEGESVWDISKRYRTHKGALCKENGLEHDTLPQRMLLLIPKV